MKIKTLKKEISKSIKLNKISEINAYSAKELVKFSKSTRKSLNKYKKNLSNVEGVDVLISNGLKHDCKRYLKEAWELISN